MKMENVMGQNKENNGFYSSPSRKISAQRLQDTTMAFFNRAGNILRQTVVINNEMSVARPSIFQMIRCISNWKVFVGGMSRITNDTNLREAFSAYGEVTQASVITDKKSGRSRGFGFVTFADYECACNAIEAMDQWELHGQTVTVFWAKDSCGDIPEHWAHTPEALLQ
ncbi:hypothetical protein SSX86_013766 [Deinandra increscens subsp. villosa]|uniref:RRM domain-containing protein n=1 Tax=Deinandra increscens subsp. villosa TaxID=3103831 RepID=A0AAP0D851_9ASTR